MENGVEFHLYKLDLSRRESGAARALFRLGRERTPRREDAPHRFTSSIFLFYNKLLKLLLQTQRRRSRVARITLLALRVQLLDQVRSTLIRVMAFHKFSFTKRDDIKKGAVRVSV